MMTDNDLLYIVALHMVPHIGDKHAKTLMQYFSSAEKIFKARRTELEKIPGIGRVRATGIAQFRNFKRAEEELKFISKYGIKPLVQGKNGYPGRLLHCDDAPHLLYYKGNTDLNTQKIISVIGTRTPSDYGREKTKEIIRDLSVFSPLVVSGLAYGIDTIAHKFSLKNRLPTVGILAHGLDRIYPAENKNLARDMVENGGLLTEFMSQTIPDAQNFPMRNRIVAGLADLVIVIETGRKGGSMITADIANSYNKDVFAMPGRATDIKSEGCNWLIRENKAILFNSGKEIAESMSWLAEEKPKTVYQPALFPEMSPAEIEVFNIICHASPAGIDLISMQSKLRASELAALLLKLEMQGIIIQLPGRFYKPA
jgi:DNA processing protein